jgi:putative addiction module component (TIGR02574 family)
MLSTKADLVTVGVMSKFAVSHVLELPIEERLRLVEEIWNSIAEAPEALELTAEDRRVLDERLAARAENPGAASPWKEALARVAARKAAS